jgi:hypothetical protein
MWLIRALGEPALGSAALAPSAAVAPFGWLDVAVLVRPEPSSVVPISAAIPFVCRPRLGA